MAEAHHDPLDPAHLFGHVQDATHFEVPKAIAEGGKIHLPQPLRLETPIFEADPVLHLAPFDLELTKFMVLEVICGIILILLFVPLALRISGGKPPRGRLWNMLEAMLLFFRDDVARPAIGKQDADRFLPFIWTVFFFILGCNLLGLVPWAGSATAALATTAALALVTFVVVLGTGMGKLGIVGFWKAQVPHLDLPAGLGFVLKPMIFIIEVMGMGIKHVVLAVRLLANMVAGHLVVAVIMAFIAATASSMVWYGVMPVSVLGATAIMLLETFVAFLQAYIFAFLTALFIGMAVHPH